jgi:hypothetical protein
MIDPRCRDPITSQFVSVECGTEVVRLFGEKLMYGDKKLGMQLTIWKLCLCIELEIIHLFAAKATIIQSSDCQKRSKPL